MAYHSGDETMGLIVVFDGVCIMCNAAVWFIIRHDRRARFTFASSQSPPGQHLLRQYGLQTRVGETIMLLRDNQAFVESRAALEITLRLDDL